MALQIHHLRRPFSPAPSPAPSIGQLLSPPTKQLTVTGVGQRSFTLTKRINSNKLRSPVRVRSSFETSGEVVVGQVTKQLTVAGVGQRSFTLTKRINSNKSRSPVRVRSSLETSGEVVVGQVTEVNKDTFWPIVNAAGDKTVVLDMYTQWCGPCKIMAPKFQELAEKYLDVVFLKLDCNQENKPLANELGIKVVPTFKILKHGKVVKEVTGTKFDNLVLAMEEVRSS